MSFFAAAVPAFACCRWIAREERRLRLYIKDVRIQCPRQTSENSPPACVPVYDLTPFSSSSSSSCVVRTRNRSSSLPIWVYKSDNERDVSHGARRHTHTPATERVDKVIHSTAAGIQIETAAAARLLCIVRVCVAMAQDDRDSIKLLKTMRGEVNWEIEKERCEFLNQFYLLIENWQGQLPNLKSIFRPEEIDWLLTEDVKIFERVGRLHRIPIVDFAYNTDYVDEPVVDEDGKPLTRRTTAVHYAASCKISELIGPLFEIYTSVDVNYIDDSGFTHFHAACMSSECYNVVELFLEQGQDPNLLVPKTGDSPLHLALRWGRNEVAQLLLRNGADPNLTNAEGSTPLHIICKKGEDDTGYYEKGDCVTVKMLLELGSEKYQPVQIDAQDKLGNTPLHLVLDYGHRRLIELLLKNGADPNSINEEGSTPLHIISMKNHDFARRRWQSLSYMQKIAVHRYTFTHSCTHARNMCSINAFNNSRAPKNICADKSHFRILRWRARLELINHIVHTPRSAAAAAVLARLLPIFACCRA
ncbi:unnamed protein product, partial [Trichogramma brassicae]